MKPLEKWTYEELIDWSARELMDALITGGAKEMRARLWVIFNAWHNWSEEEKKQKGKTK